MSFQSAARNCGSISLRAGLGFVERHGCIESLLSTMNNLLPVVLFFVGISVPRQNGWQV